MASVVKFRICPLCEAGCGLKIHVEDKKVTKVRGDENYPPSKGYMCPKGAALKELHHDPDLVRTPLIKENNSFRKATWDEAFSLIEEKFLYLRNTYGNDCMGAYLGNPNTHTMAGGLFLSPLLKSLKSKNLFTASTVDQMPKLSACGFMFGHPMRVPVPDVNNTDLFVIFGANPFVSNGSLMSAPDMKTRIKKLKQRGGKLIVVDPMKTKTAKEADLHIPINPGSDVWLLFAIVHIFFRDNMISLNQESDLIKNFEKLEKEALNFTPEKASKVCGVDVSQIEELAELIYKTQKCAVYGRMGTCTVKYGTATSWLIDVVNILAGNFDKKGGVLFPKPAHIPDGSLPKKGFKINRFKSRVSSKGEVMGELPASVMAEEMETEGEGKIRGFITVAGNPVIAVPESERLDRAMADLDFMVSVDYYINESTRHADVILPPASPLCHSHYDFFFHGLAIRNFASFSEPVFEKNENEKDKWEILAKLILILRGKGKDADPLDFEYEMLSSIASQVIKGLGGEEKSGVTKDSLISMLNGRKGPERVLDFLLRIGPYGDNFGFKPDGINLNKIIENNNYIDLGDLSPWAKKALLTPDSKIDIYPDELEKSIKDLKESFVEKRDNDFLLIGRRYLRTNNSWMHNIEALSKNNPCTMYMNPEDARNLDFNDMDTAIVSTSKSKIKIPVEINKDIKKGVVSIPHGFGHDLEGMQMNVASKNAGVNVNRIIPLEIDPISATAVLNGVSVKIEKI
ncbi:MAG: molybdopterin-dependent oxidoreductase [Desulforegulaceae bacterium]|nr:molybdopterin-dependent oxidoreductase [Desulforegulaceae bacterium]